MLSKLSLTVPDLWRRLALPGEPKPVCRCPFHPDRTASFSIYRHGQRWKCFAGCGSGDAVGLLAKATGLTNREAFRKALELAGGGRIQAVFIPLPATPELKPGNPVLPADLHRGSPLELRGVAGLRGLSLAGVELASARGLLRFGRVCGSPCWIVTDAARILAQARRMDGQPFPAFGPLTARKAHTLKSSRQSWPLGIREAADASTLLLVEGGPDLLAACHFIAVAHREHELAAVAMLGAGNHLPADALALFRAKRVRIYPDADESGEEAAVRWTEQLAGAGARQIDAFSFRGWRQPDGQPVKDLNDAARLAADAQPEGLLP